MAVWIQVCVDAAKLSFDVWIPMFHLLDSSSWLIDGCHSFEPTQYIAYQGHCNKGRPLAQKRSNGGEIASHHTLK
eukprot:1807466-Ditylum_brightwellii.AAC.2